MRNDHYSNLKNSLILNDALNASLKKYHFEKIKGYLLAATYLLSLNLGILASFASINTTVVDFGTVVVLWTVISFVITYILFTYLFVHIYKSFYHTVSRAARALVWQILALAFSILLALILSSVLLLYGGLTIFFLLLFVYPLIEKTSNKKLTPTDFKSNMDTIYGLLVVIANLIQIILQFAHLFK